MKQASNQTAEQLRSKHFELVEKLRSTPLLDRAASKLMEQIRANEAELKALERNNLLNRVNREQRELREQAALIYECEQPSEDITCNDGSFHSTKVKKYPKLAALAGNYVRGTFEKGLLKELKTGLKTFYLLKPGEYIYGKETVYTRFDTFEAFLAYNSIMPEDLTIEQYNAVCEQCEAINAVFKVQVEKFAAQKSALGLSSLNHYGLFEQRNAGHIYEYTPKN